MTQKGRIIQSETIKVKLLNGTELELRSLTLAERRECMALLPKDIADNPEQFAQDYMKVQGDIIHYIVTRVTPKFTREDVDRQFDASVIEQIITFALKDPFLAVM